MLELGKETLYVLSMRQRSGTKLFFVPFFQTNAHLLKYESTQPI